MALRLQPVRVATGSDDEEGILVQADGRLVAVLVRLSGEEHGDLRGAWFLEAGFGRCDAANPPVFPSLDAAQDWIERRVRQS